MDRARHVIGWTDVWCSPRHRMPYTRVMTWRLKQRVMTWRALSISPHLLHGGTSFAHLILERHDGRLPLLHRALGADGYCSPRHQTDSKPSVLQLNGIF
jgi:hypothetical protein